MDRWWSSRPAGPDSCDAQGPHRHRTAARVAPVPAALPRADRLEHRQRCHHRRGAVPGVPADELVADGRPARAGPGAAADRRIAGGWRVGRCARPTTGAAPGPGAGRRHEHGARPQRHAGEPPRVDHLPADDDAGRVLRARPSHSERRHTGARRAGQPARRAGPEPAAAAALHRDRPGHRRPAHRQGEHGLRLLGRHDLVRLRHRGTPADGTDPAGGRRHPRERGIDRGGPPLPEGTAGAAGHVRDRHQRHGVRHAPGVVPRARARPCSGGPRPRSACSTRRREQGR